MAMMILKADPLFDEAVALVTESRNASISSVQRKRRIGYNRAARIVEKMEEIGIVGELESNGKGSIGSTTTRRFNNRVHNLFSKDS